jgi:hypothetical protein
MKVTFYDLLDRVELPSSFSWRAAFGLLARAAATGVLPLPQACIRGTAALTFAPPDASGGGGPLLVRHVERLELTPVFASGRARNRRVARDFISFLDGRRPPGTSQSEWDATMHAALSLQSVPGLGQFDIDGLSGDDRVRLFDDVSALLTFSTLLVLIFGAAVGALYADELSRAAALRALRDDDDGGGGDAARGAGGAAGAGEAREGERMRRRRLLARALRADRGGGAGRDAAAE